MKKSKNYEIPISPNYVSNWGMKEAIRELLQNSIDAETNGYKKKISYIESEEVLIIENIGAKLSISSLVLGCSNKGEVDNMIGKFGEGYKLALVVLLRKGNKIKIINQNEEWNPEFKDSKKFGTKILNINVKDTEQEENKNLSFYIYGIDKNLYNSLIEYFPCINGDYKEFINSENGQILLDPIFKGKMFVEGLYIQTDKNFDYGYNFKSTVVELDRDRKAINYYELRKLTAESMVTAETCNTKIFKAISNSCTDVKDIIDVIDNASQEFLKEYRDMMYKENNLEKNTLVATESVKKQLEQMDISVPVVKGSEIESFLIAKANDQLGIIKEAKNEISKKTKEDEAFEDVECSEWFIIKCWYSKYKDILTEEAKEELEEILYDMEPYKYQIISDLFGDDFYWSEENFIKIKEQNKNQG